MTALQFGIQRFAAALLERRDLISGTDHRTLFQNIEEILRLAEDILEQLLADDHEPQVQFASRVYLSKSTAFCAAYKKYCNGLKRADCVLVSSILGPILRRSRIALLMNSFSGEQIPTFEFRICNIYNRATSAEKKT